MNAVELKKALLKAKRVTSKVNVPAYENALFCQGKMVATNGTETIYQDMEFRGVGTININFLLKIATKAKKRDILISFGETGWGLIDVNGLGQFKINEGAILSFYPDNVDLKEYKLTGRIKESSISECIKFVSKDELRIAMNHVLVNQAYYVATDAHTLKRVKKNGDCIRENEFTDSILISQKTASILNKSHLYDVYMKDSKHFVLVDTVNGEIVKQEAPGCKYPDYNAVIPETFETTVTVDKKKLNDQLDMVLMACNKSTNLAVFDFNGQLTLSAKDLDFNKSYDCTIPATKKGIDITIGFNAQFVQKVLNSIDSDNIKFEMTNQRRAAVINDDTLIMPVLIN